MTDGLKRVVVVDQGFGDLDVERRIIAETGCDIDAHECEGAAEAAEALRGAHAALVNMAPVDEAAVAGLAKGATLVRYGAGYDNVDVEACRRRGVSLANVPDYGTEEVAVHAMAMLLALLRRLAALDGSVRSGQWSSARMLGKTLAAGDVTLGLFGVGRIGMEMAARARAFGMSLVAHDPYADKKACEDLGIELVGRDELWGRSDAVSLHAPLTDETRHCLDGAALSAMRRHAIVVNCARGALVDTAALAKALTEGRIAAAALDVFEREPIPAGDPLLDAPNLLLTPHAAWCSERSMRRMRELAAQEIVRALRGEPLRCKVA